MKQKKARRFIKATIIAVLALMLSAASGCGAIVSIYDAIVSLSPPPPEYETYKTADSANLELPLFSGGDGTKSSPYRISSAEDLRTLSLCLRPVRWAESYANAYYVQTDDIDLSGMYWIPIGSDNIYLDPIKSVGGYPFSGKYDGNGHTIRNMKILISWDASFHYDYYKLQGLFGLVAYDDNFDIGIYNLTLESPNVQIFDEYTVAACCGGLIGSINTENVKVANCVVSGASIESYTGDVGLIAGSSSGKIIDCRAEGQLKYMISENTSTVGGYVGYNSGEITDGVSSCRIVIQSNVNPDYHEKIYAGGFVGMHALREESSISAIISNSYAGGEMILKVNDTDLIVQGALTGSNYNGALVANCKSDILMRAS